MDALDSAVSLHYTAMPSPSRQRAALSPPRLVCSGSSTSLRSQKKMMTMTATQGSQQSNTASSRIEVTAQEKGMARQTPNRMSYTLQTRTTSTSSGNSLLKMMEERMAVSAACNAVTTEQSIPASMKVITSSSSHPNNAALHASISKWSGLASADQTPRHSMNTGTVPLNHTLTNEVVMQKQQLLRHQANGLITVQSLPSPVLVSNNINLQHPAGGSETSISGSRIQSPPSQDEIQQISFNALHRYYKRSNTSLTSSTGDTNSLLTSSSTSSNKIHRSTSSNSAHASFENLRLKAQTDRLNNISMRNQSFDAHSSSGGLYSTRKSNTMANETFSIVPIDPTRHHRNAGHSTMNGRLSSNSLLSTMLTSQRSNAGSTADADAAAKFVMAVQKSRDCHLISTKSIETAAVVSHKPIQVQAEEYAAPAIGNRTLLSPTNLETGIISAIPDCIKDTTPLDIVKKALASRGFNCDTKSSMNMEEGYFVNLTNVYDQEMVNAIRSNDIKCLTRLHTSGINFQCGNRFGETLIHLACRRSNTNLVSYLINDAGVSLRVRDDFGRTPLHDACWRAEANLPLLDMLLEQAPELLMLTDKRGHTPLCYSRREHWDVLIPFLEERIDKFRAA